MVVFVTNCIVKMILRLLSLISAAMSMVPTLPRQFKGLSQGHWSWHQLTKAANFIGAYEKTYLSVCYLHAGDTSLVSVCFTGNTLEIFKINQ